MSARPPNPFFRLHFSIPGVKAIVCSGYGHDPVMSHYREHGFAGVLPKPFGVRELSEVLERKETPRQSSAG